MVDPAAPAAPGAPDTRLDAPAAAGAAARVAGDSDNPTNKVKGGVEAPPCGAPIPGGADAITVAAELGLGLPRAEQHPTHHMVWCRAEQGRRRGASGADGDGPNADPAADEGEARGPAARWRSFLSTLDTRCTQCVPQAPTSRLYQPYWSEPNRYGAS
eukprot:gene41457-62949_t